MPSKRGVTSHAAERAARRAPHDALRALATEVCELRGAIERVATKHCLPACPYDRSLAELEEYLNSCADELDDLPEATEPPLQSFDAAYAAIRKITKEHIK